MPDLTTRYGLKKPVQDGSETADLRVWVGENMDLIDAAIGEAKDTADAAGQAAAAAQQAANTAQASANAAKAAADAAQETADEALNAAGAAQSAANAAQQTADTALSAAQAAGQAAANAQATADAAVPRGDNNRAVALIHTLLLDVSTRQLHATAWTAKGNPTVLEIRDADGVTVLGTIALTYNVKEKPTEFIITVYRPGQDPIVIPIYQEFDAETGTRLVRRWTEVTGL